MWFEILIFLSSAFIAYITLQYFQGQHKIPHRKNVIKTIKSCEKYISKLQNISESKLEEILAYQLKKKFEVNTQFSLGGLKGAREKVDIDLGNGRFGIELKLAKTLRKSNERNRLLGQIDLYIQRKYSSKNILVVIIGEAKYQQDAVILELQSIITQKNVGFYFMAY